MHPILRNILAVVVGIFACMVANMAIIIIGGTLFPYELDLNNMREVKEVAPFVTPFLAHALGSIVGAVVGAKIAGSHRLGIAMFIAVFHLAGGISMVVMYPAPTWFSVLDLAVAYLPMGYLGWKLVAGTANRATTA